MSETSTDTITGYHAHVYYDNATRETAERLRAAIGAAFDVKLGRWHDDPIGPHPMGSYQVAFAPVLFGVLVPWLALNRAGLTVFIHPETGEVLPDHRDRAIWLGRQQDLDLDALE